MEKERETLSSLTGLLFRTLEFRRYNLNLIDKILHQKHHNIISGFQIHLAFNLIQSVPYGFRVSIQQILQFIWVNIKQDETYIIHVVFIYFRIFLFQSCCDIIEMFVGCLYQQSKIFIGKSREIVSFPIVIENNVVQCCFLPDE